MTLDNKNMIIDMYADVDFDRSYSTEDKIDAVSVKIRSGGLLTFGNVPILWISKLQSEITLSILEADYIDLSQGMIDLVLARRLMAELGNK